jgi:hypothetical protein
MRDDGIRTRNGVSDEARSAKVDWWMAKTCLGRAKGEDDWSVGDGTADWQLYAQ